MSIWYISTIPCDFNGFPLEMEHSDGPQEFNLAKHTPVGFTQSTIEPLGAEGQTLNCRFIFNTNYFEAHKSFLELLTACTIPNLPGVLNHPVYGPLTVYPRRVNPIIEFSVHEAVVEVTFERHFVAPELPIIMAPITISPWTGMSMPLSLAGYLAALAFMTAWNSAWLVAAMMLLRAGSVIDLVSRVPGALGAQLDAWAFGLANTYAAELDPRNADPAAPEVSPDAFARAMTTRSDQVAHAFLQSANISEQSVNDIADGGEYDAGLWSASGPAPEAPSPSPRFHAALTACAVLETHMAGVTAACAARIIGRQAQARSIDGAAAEAAITICRRRLARASHLASRAMGIHAAPVARDISYQGAQLLGLLERFPVIRTIARQMTVQTPKPLALLALDWLGDASRAGEIRALNPRLVADFNRLPRGTVLTVPA